MSPWGWAWPRWPHQPGRCPWAPWPLMADAIPSAAGMAVPEAGMAGLARPPRCWHGRAASSGLGTGSRALAQGGRSGAAAGAVPLGSRRPPAHAKARAPGWDWGLPRGLRGTGGSWDNPPGVGTQLRWGMHQLGGVCAHGARCGGLLALGGSEPGVGGHGGVKARRSRGGRGCRGETRGGSPGGPLLLGDISAGRASVYPPVARALHSPSTHPPPSPARCDPR